MKCLDCPFVTAWGLSSVSPSIPHFLAVSGIGVSGDNGRNIGKKKDGTLDSFDKPSCDGIFVFGLRTFG